MAAWQPARFMVRVYTGEPRPETFYWAEREGWMRGIWGLHQGPWGPFGQIDWLVTHVPTGLLLQSFRTRRDAEWFVRQIEHHPDWDAITTDGETVHRPEALGALVREALTELERRDVAKAKQRLGVA